MSTPSELKESIKLNFFAGNVSMVRSSPGVGKSEIVQQIADEFNVKLITITLSLFDPTLVGGFPAINGSKTSFFPLDLFPIEGDPVPEGKAGFLLFMDEINTAARLVQASCYRIILDRMVGSFKLHPNTQIVCAGNNTTDNALAEELSTAMQSRMIHYDLEANVKDWTVWAYENNIDTRIISFVNWKGLSALNNFDPDHSDHTYACPRSYSFLNRILKVSDKTPRELRQDVAGTIGKGIAEEFITYCDIYAELPSVEDIVKSEGHCSLPSNVSAQYAYTGLLGNALTEDTLPIVMDYIYKFDPELQVLILRAFLSKDLKRASMKEIQEWSEKIGNECF